MKYEINIHEYNNGEEPNYKKIWDTATSIEHAEQLINDYWSEKNSDGDRTDHDNKQYAFSLEPEWRSRFVYKIDYKECVVLPSFKELDDFINNFNDELDDEEVLVTLENACDIVDKFRGEFREEYGIDINGDQLLRGYYSGALYNGIVTAICWNSEFSYDKQTQNEVTK